MAIKKWRAPRYSDQATLANMDFVWAEHPDEFGPRAFQIVNLFWDDEMTSFLSDAATDWGMAPFALFEARESQKLRALGDWDQFQAKNAKACALMFQACHGYGEEESSRFGSLLVVRAALRLTALAAKSPKPFGLDVAKHCLKQEIDRDAQLMKAKSSAHKAMHPDYMPPDARGG